MCANVWRLEYVCVRESVGVRACVSMFMRVCDCICLFDRLSELSGCHALKTGRWRLIMSNRTDITSRDDDMMRLGETDVA